MQEFLRQQTAQKAIDGDGTENRQTQQPAQMHQTCCNIQIQPGWSACPSCGKMF